MDPIKLIKTHGIALTGGIATGKSTAAKMIASHGFLVIDADQLARLAVTPGSQALGKIIHHFGKDYLNEDGSLNRQKMSATVFSDKDALAKLEQIIHPEIEKLFFKTLENQGLTTSPRTFFYEASLIFENNKQDRFFQIWVTWCPRELQKSRLMERNQITSQEAEKIISQQMNADLKRELADVVIHTDTSLDKLAHRIEQLLSPL